MKPTESNLPQLPDLLMGYLQRPVDAESVAAGAAAMGEVEPHEVAVGFRADPRLAWNEGVETLTVCGVAVGAEVKPPAEWAAIVVRHSSMPAIPFAAGNYPQRVRELGSLIQAKDRTRLRPLGEATKSQPVSTTVRDWTDKQLQQTDFARKILAIGLLRSAHDFSYASSVLEKVKASADESQRVILANEEAALLWHQGSTDSARKVWQSLAETPAVCFNRGMAALFHGDQNEAREFLGKAVNALPESSAWHHLANVYLSLVELPG